MSLSHYTATERGRIAQLAQDLGVSAAFISQMASGARVVPLTRCPAIERATVGAVPCEALRPDVRWVRLADAAWPWHPAGRPLIDVSTPQEA